jgi:hypothetical protein
LTKLQFFIYFPFIFFPQLRQAPMYASMSETVHIPFIVHYRLREHDDLCRLDGE